MRVLDADVLDNICEKYSIFFHLKNTNEFIEFQLVQLVSESMT